MKTKELVKKAGVVKIDTTIEKTLGTLKAIEIAISNTVAINSCLVRIASSICCKRAAIIVFENKNFARK